MTTRPLTAQELPGLLESFTHQQSGLIVFAGGRGSGRTTSAYALAERVAAAGRCVVAISEGPVIGTAVRAHPVRRRRDIPDAVRAEAAAGATVLLVDSDQDTDSLSSLVEAAAAGALVIATLDNRGTGSYIHLLNLIEAAEDWGGGLRADFEACLCAVITQTLADTESGATLAADIHPGRRGQK